MQLMQLNNMDCSSARSSNAAERDSDLGEDLSHDEHSDDEMRDCDSVEGNIEQRQQQQLQQQHQQHQQQQQQQQHQLQHYHHQQHHLSTAHHHRSSRRLNPSLNSGGEMSFVGASAATAAGGIGSGGVHSPVEQTELQMNHHHQFPPNHPLNALGNFMGIGGLHGIPNLQHSDVLEKLKMQVRDMKVGLMEQDYAAHAAAFGANVLPTPINTAFTLPPTSTMSTFGHVPTGNSSVTNGSTNTALSASSSASTHANGGGGGGGGVGSGNGSFSFASPTPPNSKDVNPASNSSTSSETSNSSTQQNNGWSFEEQYKQVRQLYEINDDPKRKEFLDELFSFMQKRGTPINRLPIMAKSVLDLYELYNLVIARGGLVEVINKKLWQEIIKGLHLPSSITSAAFTLRTQYMKYLYPFECDKMNLSAPSELQAAIDGNRREGRRSSYGQYEAMQNHMHVPQIARQSLAGSMNQISPLALVTHAAASNQQAHAAAAAVAAHHRLIAPTFGQMPNLVTHELEQRMMEYLKMLQVKNDPAGVAMSAGLGSNVGNASGASGVAGSSASSLVAAAAAAQQQQQQHQQHQQQQQKQQLQQQAAQRQSSPSPDISPRDALNALEMSRVALWQMYHNNTSPPASVNTSPQLGAAVGGGGVGGVGADANAVSQNGIEPQREALNLSDTPPHIMSIKREHVPEPDDAPATKRTGFPASFYFNMAAAAVNFQHAAHVTERHRDLDTEHDDEADEDAEHNTTGNTSLHDEHDHKAHLNGLLRSNAAASLLRHEHHNSLSAGQQHNNDKSDDSAIENSPTTSTSVGNGHMSPISTKKTHLSKQSNINGASGTTSTTTAFDAVETLNLLSGLQFKVRKSGTNANGEPFLTINLELNGLKYSGVLTAPTVSRPDEAFKADKTTKRATDTSAPTMLSMSSGLDAINVDKDNTLRVKATVNAEEDESDAETDLTATPTNDVAAKMLPKANSSNTATATATTTTTDALLGYMDQSNMSIHARSHGTAAAITTTTTTDAAITNGPSSVGATTAATLKDSFITT